VGERKRRLRIRFGDAAAFEREYRANLVNGGVFVATEEAFELREPIAVELVLAYAGGRSLRLEGEVVHQVPAALAGAGAIPGVAVQLLGGSAELRQRLAPLAEAGGVRAPAPRGPDRRQSERILARVAARIEGGEGAASGHTRNLSQNGTLVSVAEPGIAVGERVSLTLVHPTTGEALGVEGLVTREVGGAGGVAALAVQFDPPEERRAEVAGFLEDLSAAERARRLGGIAGEIAELGVQSLVSMLAGSARAGTLSLRRAEGEAEGLIGFEGGLLRYARLDAASGMKALVRLLAWEQGRFEFHARLDPVEGREPPLPLEAALLEALRMLDELRLVDPARFPAAARPRLAGPAPDPPAGNKLEQAVLDLAAAGASVGRMLEVIPEPDPEIYRALARLCDEGRLVVDGGPLSSPA
jgi:Tfp pilus assembly protein PilZ